MVKMFKLSLKIILIANLLVNIAGQGYALRPMAASVDNRGISHSIFSPKLHRKAEQKVERIERLLEDVDRLLQEKNLTLQVNLADFRHAYKYSLPVSWDKSAIIRSADLVTLELPDASVRPYREGKGKLARSDNPFWQDALDKLFATNLASSIYGVNSAEIRYYITRMVAYLGIPLTLEREEPAFVLMDKNTKYNLQELGGTESKSISYEQLLAALTNRQRAELEKKRMLNLKENQNPFGEKYLLLYYPPDRDIIGLMDDVLEIFSPLFEEYFIEYDEQLQFIFKNLIVRVLTVQNDFWQAELALTKIKQLLESRERNDSKRSVAFSYVHIGGAVHGGSLEEYWRLSKSRRINVRHCIDRRVPIPHYSRRSPIQDYDLEEILSLTWFDSKHKRLVFGRQRLFEFFNTIISSNQEYFNRILVAEFASQMANTMKGFVTKRKEVVEKGTPVDLAVTYYLDHKIKFILSYIPFEQLICFLKEGSGFDYRDLLAFCILYPEDSRFMFSKKTVDLTQYVPEEAIHYLNYCEPAKEAGAEPFYLQPFLAVTDRNDKMLPVTPAPAEGVPETKNIKSSSASKRATEKPSALPEYTIPTVEALEKAEGNQTITARILKKDIRTVLRRIEAIREATDKDDSPESRAMRRRLEEALKGKMAGKRSFVMPKFTKPTIRAIEKAKGNKTQAAIILGIEPANIHGRIESIRETLEKLDTPGSRKLLDRLNRALAAEMAGKHLVRAKERKPEKPFVLRRYEDETIEALEKAKGSRVTAAKILDITPTTLRQRIKTLERAADEDGTLEARGVINRLKDALAGEMAGKRSKEVLEREKKKRLKLPKYTYNIINALEIKKGNQTGAARSLGISPRFLHQKINRIRKIVSEINTPKSRAVLKRLEDALAGKWAHKRTLGLPEYTRETIEALEYSKGNKALAAKYLGISPGGMTKRISRIEEVATVIDTPKSRAVLKRLRKALAGKWAGKNLSTLPSARAAPGQGKPRTKNIKSSAAGSTPNRNPFLTEQPLIKGNAINVFELEKLFNNAISKFSASSVAIWGSLRYMADSDGYMVISDEGKRKIHDLDMMCSLGNEKFFLEKEFAAKFARAVNQKIKGRGYSERLSFVFEEKAKCSYLHFSLTGDKKKDKKTILGIHSFDTPNPGYHVFTSLTEGFDHTFQIISCLCQEGNLPQLKFINKKNIPKIISWYLSVAYFFGLPTNYESIREEWAKIRNLEQEYRDFCLRRDKKVYASYLALAKKIMKDKEFAALRDYVEANLKQSGTLMRTVEARLNIQIIPPELDPQNTFWRVVYPADNLATQAGGDIIYALPKEITVNNQRLRMVALTPELMLDKADEFFTLQNSVAAEMDWTKERDVIGVAQGQKDGPIAFDTKLNCSFTVLDEEDVPVAVAMYSSADERKDYVYLETLAVLPEYQGTGVASWILLHSFQEAKRQYFTHASWNAREELDETEKAHPYQRHSARAIPYYEKRVKAERDEKKGKNGRIRPKEQTMDVTTFNWEIRPGKWHIAYHKDLGDLSSLYADFQAKSALPQKLIAVIGASGFLGKKIYATFKKIHTDVIGTSYTKEGFYHLDVTDEEEVKTFFEQFHPEVVIYAAGETDVDRAEKRPSSAMSLNADALDLISKYFKGHFIYISTDYVFDGRKAPYAPDARCKPLNEYGKSKMLGEKKALSNFEKAAILRIGILYGYNDGQDRDTFFKQIVKKIAQGEDIIVDNEQIKHPVWLDDVVRLIVAIVQEGSSGIFQLNGTEAMTRYDWAKLIASVYQSVYPDSTIGPIKGEFIKGFAPRPHNAELVNTLVPTSLGTGTEQTIRSMSALIELLEREKTEAEIHAQA